MFWVAPDLTEVQPHHGCVTEGWMYEWSAYLPEVRPAVKCAQMWLDRTNKGFDPLGMSIGDGQPQHAKMEGHCARDASPPLGNAVTPNFGDDDPRIDVSAQIEVSLHCEWSLYRSNNTRRCDDVPLIKGDEMDSPCVEIIQARRPLFFLKYKSSKTEHLPLIRCIGKHQPDSPRLQSLSWDTCVRWIPAG